MAAPGTVIQGGVIPPGWQPQAIPYQAPGPDGKPITVYIAPTYVFTYAVGPPVAVPPPPNQVNRIQAYRPAPVPGWNYQAQGMAPVGTTLPAVTRSAPVPYQYPPGSPALAGQPMVPPPSPLQAPAPASAMVAQAAPVAPPAPAIQAPPSQWVSAPPDSAPPTIDGQALAGAAPAVMAGTAGAIAVANQPPPPTASIPPPPADPVLAPVGTPPPQVVDPAPPQPALQPTSPSPSAAGPRATNTHLWRVVGVHDGDTITCLDENNTQQKVRLAEIDAPELGQDFGKVARESLAEMVFGKTVTFQDEGKDRYGRWIGHVDVNGTNVNRQMVATGNAWHYADYSRDPSLAGLQSQAQSQRSGLWSQPDPVPPWEFRASLKKAAAG